MHEWTNMYFLRNSLLFMACSDVTMTIFLHKMYLSSLLGMKYVQSKVNSWRLNHVEYYSRFIAHVSRRTTWKLYRLYLIF